MSSLIFVSGIGVAVVWGIEQNKQSDWWAAWGQWIGGIGSIAAAAVAVGIASEGWRRADQGRKDNESMQARLVTSEIRYPTPSEDFRGIGCLRVNVVNHSNEPVHLPRLVEIQNSAAWVTGFEDGLAVARKHDYEDYQEPDVLGPGESTDFLADYVIDESKRPEEYEWEPGIAVISFTDARGVRWQRRGNEEPERRV
jgi:hypothetical protein